jgi:hypothetical protein
LPVAEEPVKLMTSICGDWLMARPMAAPDSVNEHTTPAGRPTMEVRHSSVSWFTKAVWCAALITTVQPAASAGASDRMSRITGAFQGTMMPATPAGSRLICE